MYDKRVTEKKSRLTLYIRPNVKRLAKSKAIAKRMSLEYVVDRLLQAWLRDEVTVNGEEDYEGPSNE